MIYIAHRGNINGIQEDQENRPSYIEKAISLKYNVEIDLWFISRKYYLGHDEPQYEIDRPFLERYSDFLWIHCKNIEALVEIKDNFNCFFHINDDAVLTSSNYIWTYPNKKLFASSIVVLPETVNYTDEDIYGCSGICSDIIGEYVK
jgi:hypothetical protein